MMSENRRNSGFGGARVLAFESRMAGAMGDLIAKHGGIPAVAPSLREVPIEDDSEAKRFAERLLNDEFDVVLFETGVGARFLATAIEATIPRERWIAALNRAKVVARGPKPVAALREFAARIDIFVPEPNTWRETLATLDAELPVSGLRVAVQEYGEPNPELIDGLKARGASVSTIAVYRWALPENLEPLRDAVSQLINGEAPVILFTSAKQPVHLLQVAESEGRAEALRTALGDRVLIGSVGPSTSASLRDLGLRVDVEPIHPKMGHLVAAAAAKVRENIDE